MMSWLRAAFTQTNSRTFLVVNDMLATVTVVSVLTVVLETVPALEMYQPLFTVVEWIAVVIFTAEYISRTIVSKPVGRYNVSFFGWVDLLAVVPTFFGLGNYTFLKTARTIRLIRLLRILRLAKLKQLKTPELEENISFVALNVLLFMTVLGAAVLLMGTVMYVLEGNNPAFQSIPHAMFWSFKVFLIGLPITYPETVLGELGHVVARVVGLVVFGVLINVAGNLLKEYLFTNRR